MAANTDARHFRLKAGQADLIALCGGIERAAEVCKFSTTTVGRWNNRDDPTLMPISALLDLQEECGHRVMTEVLASLGGCKLTRPAVERAPELAQQLAGVVHASGEMISTIVTSLADGKVTPAEAAESDRRLATLEKLISLARKACAEIKASGGLSVVQGGAAS